MTSVTSKPMGGKDRGQFAMSNIGIQVYVSGGIPDESWQRLQDKLPQGLTRHRKKGVPIRNLKTIQPQKPNSKAG